MKPTENGEGELGAVKFKVIDSVAPAASAGWANWVRSSSCNCCGLVFVMPDDVAGIEREYLVDGRSVEHPQRRS